MVKTYGLTHIALAVKDAGRSSRFYQKVFGAVETYRGEGWAQVETVGTHDVIVFTEEEHAGKAGGIQHFGFRLTDPDDIGIAAQAVEEAGGTIKSRGEFCPGAPYLFFSDPDGYEVEIWYEPERG
ncbi:MAG TPA: VOC family protein [Thermoanaerobaculia bacterium]|nr:VOC family protein [Thermoanaerobaculia bacterium]